MWGWAANTEVLQALMLICHVMYCIGDRRLTQSMPEAAACVMYTLSTEVYDVVLSDKLNVFA